MCNKRAGRQSVLMRAQVFHFGAALEQTPVYQGVVDGVELVRG